MNSDYNGQVHTTQDTPREEGMQKGQRQRDLHEQARADSAIHQRKRDRIIYVENSSNIRDPFILQEVATVPELLKQLCTRYPKICLDRIGFKVSNSRQGTIGRKVLTNEIAYDYDTLYLTLVSLKPPHCSESKIETRSPQ